ncbi:MAG: hypothetical protein IJH20_01065 [Bacilli bacterium]|nr:hypothetical protein [Bacilli bacterium]
MEKIIVTIEGSNQKLKVPKGTKLFSDNNEVLKAYKKAQDKEIDSIIKSNKKVLKMTNKTIQ